MGIEMEVIHWNDAFNIGHVELDSQHQQLVGMIADLQRSLCQGLVNPQVGVTLKELVQYTKTHFQFEQELMQKSGYPHYAEHVRLHQHMIDQIVKILHDLRQGESVTAIQLRELLKGWLVHHIMQEDKKIGEYLQQLAKAEKAPLAKI